MTDGGECLQQLDYQHADTRHHPSQNQTMGDSSERIRRDDKNLATLVKILSKSCPRMVAVAMPKNILSAIEIMRAHNLWFAPPPLLHKVMVAHKKSLL